MGTCGQLLNRLFIAIGVVVILAIGAAFIVPRFIQWGDYRERMETIASEAVGAPVKITGDIRFTLLPQPELQFIDVVVGDEAAPAVRVGAVQAKFSLLDFLRDQYHVTWLALIAPELDLTIGPDGAISTGITLGEKVAASNVSVAEAVITGGTIRVRDQRSAQTLELSDLGGEVTLESLRGPFSFQGVGVYGSAQYALRVSSGKADETGATPLSLFVKAAGDAFTLNVDGGLTNANGPRFAGTLSYRQRPPRPAEGVVIDAGRGDMVLEGKLDGGADRVVLSGYTLVLDENRPSARLTGAVDFRFGAKPAFKAVVSGGVIALPPRDATAELTDPPYELVRLLGEIPAPPVPPIAGTVNLDIAELNLRAVSLRDVRMDAETDGTGWRLGGLKATLPGGGSLGLDGALKVVEGKVAFDGRLTAETKRLDLLAQQWRKTSAGNPLFNVAGAVSAGIALTADTLSLKDASLSVGELQQSLDVEIGFGATTRHLKLASKFGALTPEQGEMIASLLPDLAGNGSFGATFPKGEVDLSAEAATLFGVAGTGLALTASWDAGVLDVERFAAKDLGGAQFDAHFTAFGTLQKPELSGEGTLKIANGNAPVLASVFGALQTQKPIQDALLRQLPADLEIKLDPPTGEGGQRLVVDGKAGAANVSIDAKLGAGVANALNGSLNATIDLDANVSVALSEQLGLGQTPIFPADKPLHLKAVLDGSPGNSVETRLTLEGGDDIVSFAGNVVASDLGKISGNGTVQATLGSPGAGLAALGGAGVYVPPTSGTASLRFDERGFELGEIEGKSGESKFTGALSLARVADSANVSGALSIDTLDARALLSIFAGADEADDALWRDTALAIGTTPRTTSGRVAISAAKVDADGAEFLTDTRFDLDWDKESIRIRGLEAQAGEGKVTLDAAICCAGPLADKRLNGRLTVAGVDIDRVVPAPIAATLGGKLDASAQFDGTGSSVAAIMGAMTGNGIYAVNVFSAEHFDPNAFAAASGFTAIETMEPEQLRAAIAEAVAAGPFNSPMLSGAFTIAGGVLRSPNLSIDGPAARIFGGASLKLSDLMLSGRYSMTPVAIVAAATGIDTATAEIAVDLSGPVWDPAALLDVSAMADGMYIKAKEAELAELERLAAEAEARRIAAAAEEAARLKAEQEAAAKKAAEAEAARKAAEAAKPKPPIDLGL
jgi:hypothetical protein